jgi:hypothetical protein
MRLYQSYQIIVWLLDVRDDKNNGKSRGAIERNKKRKSINKEIN